ncbi:MAG: RecX family transcriptional regulator [Bacilli bacterium]|nr:RecX family transcriptional regulator [Bacilli bacterium]
MHIDKYTKLKNGQYKLSFDNGTNALVHEDLILKYNLLINKELDEELLETILKENQSYIAYGLAIGYLKTKMRSQKEIKEYLQKKDITEDLINNAIAILKKQGYINDEIYCKCYINDRINLSNDGPYKIKENLSKLGIVEEIINHNILIFDSSLEQERIKKLINKYLKNNHNKSGFILKRKMIDNLTKLGYTKSIVISEVEKVKIDDKNIMEKEYKKIHDKLSKKYSGKELEYKVKQKMYQKGFFIE